MGMGAIINKQIKCEEKMLKRKPDFLLIAMMFLMTAGAVSADSGVLFYASYDGTADAQLARGEKAVEAFDGGPQFRQGVRGQALLSGSEAGYVTYAVDGNLNVPQGAIEFWFNPVNWDAGDRAHHHTFFEAARPSWIMFYKYYSTSDAYFWLGEDQGTKRMITPLDLNKTPMNQWSHVVLTWCVEEACVYLNGELESKYPEPRLPLEVTGRFLVGDRPWLTTDAKSEFKHKVETMMDELYIYNRALTPQEAAWAYENAMDRKGGEDIPQKLSRGVVLKAQVYPSKKVFQGVVQVDPRYPLDGLQAVVNLEPAGSAEEVILELNEHTRNFVLPYKKLTRGPNRVLVSLLRDGKCLAEAESGAAVYPGEPEWWGNTIGIPENEPPSPWTAMTYQEARGLTAEHIGCWGRNYFFDQTMLPAQIETQSTPLLAGPVILGGTNFPGEWEPAGEAKTKAGPVEVYTQATIQSDLGCLTVQRQAEFDGMIRYDLTLRPQVGREVDCLELRVPLRPEVARLFHLTKGTRGVRSGYVPEGVGRVLKMDWLSYWWAGTEKLGLAVFCESDQAWDRIDREDGFYVERKPESVDFVWRFIDGPAALPGEWHFTFGIQATPVKKPFPRSAMVSRGLPGGTFSLPWPNPSRDKYYGFPGAKDPEAYRQMVKEHHDRNQTVGPYMLLNYLSMAVPEWSFYGAEWASDEIWPSIGDVGRFGYPLGGCLPLRSWADFVVWSNKQFVYEMDLDGLYHDFTWPMTGSSPEKGFGYVRDGEVRPCYSIFAVRDLYKRIYTMLKEHSEVSGRRSQMIVHTSSPMVVPIFSFSDAYVAGEEYRYGLSKNGSYMATLTLDEFRAKYHGDNYGVVPIFLPNFRAEDMYKEGTGYQVAGLSLLHNTNLWGLSWCNAEELGGVMKKIYDFNHYTAEFLPYWNNEDLVQGQSETLKCSAYRQEDGRLLLCVFNASPSNSSRSALRVVLPENTVSTIQDVLEEKPVSHDQGAFEVELQPERIAIYLVTPE
jgi:hypothetical protein